MSMRPTLTLPHQTARAKMWRRERESGRGVISIPNSPTSSFLPVELRRREENPRKQHAVVATSAPATLFPSQHDSNSRHFVEHTYRDHANDREEENLNFIRDDSASKKKTHMDSGIKYRTQRARGGVTVPFPMKLHGMLENIEKDGLSSIVSWQSHGRAFLVHKPKEFVGKVMPKYFRQTKITSFQRQLNLYGFRRITKGTDTNAYYHELFLRGKPFLASKMMRTKIKGTGFKAASSPDTEPNFYKMAAVEEGMDSLLPRRSSTLLKVPVVKQHHSLPSRIAAPVSPECKPVDRHMSVISPTSSFGSFVDPALVSPFDEQNIMETNTSFESHAFEESDGEDVVVFEGKSFHYLDDDEVAPNKQRRNSLMSPIPPSLLTPILDPERPIINDSTSFPSEFGEDILGGLEPFRSVSIWGNEPKG